MVEKIFGLLFIFAAVLFAWKFGVMSNGSSDHNKKSHSSTQIAGNTKHSPKSTNEEFEEVTGMVADLRSLLDQQTDLVGLSDNIQRITLNSHLDSKELNSSISKSLKKIAHQSETGPYLLEAEVFDMTGPGSPRKNKNSLPDKVVFQFSIFDVQSKNKVGEFGATYDLALVAPELLVPSNNESSFSGKKKPDETYASPGSK